MNRLSYIVINGFFAMATCSLFAPEGVVSEGRLPLSERMVEPEYRGQKFERYAADQENKAAPEIREMVDREQQQRAVQSALDSAASSFHSLPDGQVFIQKSDMSDAPRLDPLVKNQPDFSEVVTEVLDPLLDDRVGSNAPHTGAEIDPFADFFSSPAIKPETIPTSSSSSNDPASGVKVIEVIAKQLDAFSGAREQLQNMSNWLDLIAQTNKNIDVSKLKRMIDEHLSKSSPTKIQNEQFVRQMRTELRVQSVKLENSLRAFSLDEALSNLKALNVRLDEKIVPKSVTQNITDFFSHIFEKVRNIFVSKQPSSGSSVTVENALKRLQKARDSLEESRAVTVSESFQSVKQQAAVIKEVDRVKRVLNARMVDINELRIELMQAGLIAEKDEVYTVLLDVLSDLSDQYNHLEDQAAKAFSIDYYTVELRLGNEERTYTATQLIDLSKNLSDLVANKGVFSDVIQLSRLELTLENLTIALGLDLIPDDRFSNLIDTLNRVRDLVNQKMSKIEAKAQKLILDSRNESKEARELLLAFMLDSLPPVDSSSSIVGRIEKIKTDIVNAAGAGEPFQQILDKYKAVLPKVSDIEKDNQTLKDLYNQALDKYVDLVKRKRNAEDVSGELEALMTQVSFILKSNAERAASYNLGEMLGSLPAIKDERLDTLLNINEKRQVVLDAQNFYPRMERDLVGLQKGVADLLNDALEDAQKQLQELHQEKPFIPGQIIEI